MKTRSIFYRTCGHRYECPTSIDEMSELTAEWFRHSDCESCRLEGCTTVVAIDFFGKTLYLPTMLPPEEQRPRPHSSGHLPMYVLAYLRPELQRSALEEQFMQDPEAIGNAVLWLAEHGRL